jgi:hypothetical protein
VCTISNRLEQYLLRLHVKILKLAAKLAIQYLYLVDFSIAPSPDQALLDEPGKSGPGERGRRGGKGGADEELTKVHIVGVAEIR